MLGCFYIYGPHFSRRIGISLGIDLLVFPPYKKCTMDCVYCELGETPKMGFFPPDRRFKLDDDFFVEMEQKLPLFLRKEKTTSRNLPEIDTITVGYSGEPTLCENLGVAISHIKKIRNEYTYSGSNTPEKPKPAVSVFTNSTTLETFPILKEETSEKILNETQVMKNLLEAEVIITKLDAATQSTFKKINRPHQKVPNVKEIVKSLALLQKMAKKKKVKLVIQTLLVGGSFSNSERDDIDALINAYRDIAPDLIHIYTIFRPPAVSGALAINQSELDRIAETMRNELPAIEIKAFGA